MQSIRILAAAAVAICMSGCSSLPFGGKQAAREAADKAQRVPMIAADQVLTADPNRAAVAVFLPDADGGPDWPQSGGSKDKSVGHRVGAMNFEIDWKADAGKGSGKKSSLIASPVEAGGVVYLIDANQSIQAIDAITGNKLWSKALEPLRKRDKVANGGGVAIAGDKLIVTSGYGYVTALELDDGAEVWQRVMQAPVTGAPTVGDNNAYITTSNNEIYVLRLSDGQVLWSDQAIAESARVLSAPSPALSDDIVVAPFSSGELIAYLPANGRRLWTNSLTRGGRFTPISSINDIAGRPVLSEGLVIAASQSGVLAGVDEVSGVQRWSIVFGSIQSPAVSGQFVFAVNTDGQVVCVDKNDGGVIWVTQLTAFENEKKRKNRIVWTGPVIASGKLILASSSGQAVSISPQTGEIEKTLKIGDPVYVEPIVAKERVYLLTDDAKLVAIR